MLYRLRRVQKAQLFFCVPIAMFELITKRRISADFFRLMRKNVDVYIPLYRPHHAVFIALMITL
jgi:hypothetical protein